MNHQGLRWNVHCVANVRLRKRLNLYKHGSKIYDLLFFFIFFRVEGPRPSLGRTKDSRESRALRCFVISEFCEQLIRNGEEGWYEGRLP